MCCVSLVSPLGFAHCLTFTVSSRLCGFSQPNEPVPRIWNFITAVCYNCYAARHSTVQKALQGDRNFCILAKPVRAPLTSHSP